MGLLVFIVVILVVGSVLLSFFVVHSLVVGRDIGPSQRK